MDISEKVADIIAARFNIAAEDITPETTIHELGADSIDFVDMVIELEDELQTDVPDEEFENIKTVGDLIEILERE